MSVVTDPNMIVARFLERQDRGAVSTMVLQTTRILVRACFRLTSLPGASFRNGASELTSNALPAKALSSCRFDRFPNLQYGGTVSDT